MEIDKVCRGLECLIQMTSCVGCPYWDSGRTRKDCLSHIGEDAIALLKEREPLAVYEDKVNKCVCGNEINRYWHPEYCGFCGKKLLWY